MSASSNTYKVVKGIMLNTANTSLSNQNMPRG